MKILTINRAKWECGTGGGKLLRIDTGKMCCLGFFGRSCGISQNALAGKGRPEEVRRSRWPAWLIHGGNKNSTSDDTEDLIFANDDEDINGKQREKRIAELFAKHGIRVRFTGKYQP